jgi:hypothetical protein
MLEAGVVSTLAVLILSSGIPGGLELAFAADEEGEGGLGRSAFSADLFARCAKQRMHGCDGYDCNDGFLNEVIGDGGLDREAGRAAGKFEDEELEESRVDEGGPCTRLERGRHRCCCRASLPALLVLLPATQDE